MQAIVGLLFVSLAVGAQPVGMSPTDADRAARLHELIPGADAGEITGLLRDGVVRARIDTGPRLAPAFTEPIAERIAAIDSSIGVEMVMVRQLDPPRSAIDDTIESSLGSISGMEGIEYYSASRGRSRVLFHESYAIAGPNDRRRVPDPVGFAGTGERVVHVFQRDSSFGSNVLELTYRSTESAVWIAMKNLTPMFYQGFVPAVRAEQLTLHVVAYVDGDLVIFYGVCAARTGILMGMERRVEESFANRLVALAEWFLSGVSRRS
ncbi:MAG: hypothetical protein EA382_09950 [Spirochaetaceae bacterium]|nr:MAG: hypothetical protein EA382_09950 [Spirochaetaceae bacterium]